LAAFMCPGYHCMDMLWPSKTFWQSAILPAAPAGIRIWWALFLNRSA